uniref:Uncharacterized protein n=1 Tax=Plectus sambesii TaxID=2011161 RepID=A0A914WU30_9BILA
MQRANLRSIIAIQRTAPVLLSRNGLAAAHTSAPQDKHSNERNQKGQGKQSGSPGQQKSAAKEQIKKDPPSLQSPQDTRHENMNSDQKRTAEESAKKTEERVWKVGAEREN